MDFPLFEVFSVECQAMRIKIDGKLRTSAYDTLKMRTLECHSPSVDRSYMVIDNAYL